MAMQRNAHLTSFDENPRNIIFPANVATDLSKKLLEKYKKDFLIRYSSLGYLIVVELNQSKFAGHPPLRYMYLPNEERWVETPTDEKVKDFIHNSIDKEKRKSGKPAINWNDPRYASFAKHAMENFIEKIKSEMFKEYDTTSLLDRILTDLNSGKSYSEAFKVNSFLLKTEVNEKEYNESYQNVLSRRI